MLRGRAGRADRRHRHRLRALRRGRGAVDRVGALVPRARHRAFPPVRGASRGPGSGAGPPARRHLRGLGAAARLPPHGAGHRRAGDRAARALHATGLRRRRPRAVGRQDLPQRDHAEGAGPLAAARAAADDGALQPLGHAQAVRACRRTAGGRLPARRRVVLQERARHAEPSARGRAPALAPPLRGRRHAGGAARRRSRARPGRLRDRLLEGARVWLALLDAWPEARLLGRLDYRRLAGQAVSLPFAATLLHVFNHGTHHRGQITAAITAMGHPGPEIDLVWMLQQESADA